MRQKSLLFSIVLMAFSLCVWSQSAKPGKVAENHFRLGEAASKAENLMLAQALYNSFIF